MHQHVAPIVHVGKFMAGHGPAHLGINRSQFLQCVGAQTGKHQKTIHSQHTVPFSQQSFRVCRLMQQHIGPYQLHALRLQGLGLELRLKPTLWFPPRCAVGRLHPFDLFSSICIQMPNGFRVTLAQQSQDIEPCPQRIPAHPRLGLQTNEGQPFLHAARHLFVQPRRFGAAWLEGL